MSAAPSRRACEGLLWFILFFAPAAFGATEWWSRAVLEGLIFCLAAMCAARRDFHVPVSAPLAGFGVILGIGCLQLLQAHPANQPLGLIPFTVSRPQTVYALMFWAALTALYWSASGIFRWDGALRRASWAIFGTGLFIAVVGILQRGQGNTAFYGFRPIRPDSVPFGPFTNPNHAANWMAASTLLGAGLVWDLLPRRSLPLSDRAAQTVLGAFLICLSGAAVLATRSRGGTHALLLSALFTAGLVAIRGRLRLFLMGGVALAGAAYAGVLYAHPKWIGLVGSAADGSAGERLSMYRAGFRLLADFPVFGTGLGGFQTAFVAYKEPIVHAAVDHLHSSWLEVALEAGVFGAAALGASFLLPIAALGRRLAGAGSGAPAAGLFAAVLALVLHGLVDFNFQIAANAAVMAVILAAVTARLAPGEGRPVPVGGSRAPLAVVFLVLAMLSLPPGLSAGRPRLGAPFASPGDSLVARAAVKP